jgi:HEAT repeat protein
LRERDDVPDEVALALWRLDPPRAQGGVLTEGREQALDVLVHKLRSPAAALRASAVGALGELGPEAGRAAPAVTRALKDAIEEVRIGAAAALGRLGCVNSQVKPALLRALEDDAVRVRAAAAVALCRIEPNCKEGVAVLVRLVETEVMPSFVGPSLIESLGELGPNARGVFPALLRALRREPEFFWDAAQALHHLDPEAAVKNGIP